MDDSTQRAMREALRLTGSGRLSEATARLQRIVTGSDLPGALAVPAAPDVAPPAVPLTVPVVPAGGRFLTGAFSNESGSRAYKLYVPGGYTGGSIPLIVMLHGCSQSTADFAAGTRMNAVAEEAVCLVVYPEQPSSANASRCWNWFKPQDQQRGLGEPSLVAGITRQVMRTYAVDPQRIYVAGLSAGGAAAAVLGEAYPDLYAALGIHSGLACCAARDLSTALTAMRSGSPVDIPERSPGSKARRVVPTIVFHGDRDTTVHPCNGDRIIARTMATNLVTTVSQGRVPGGHAYTRTVHADPRGEAILEQWVVHGSGHAWSGGSPNGSFTDPRGPDASREMVRFFLGHVHPEETTRR